MLKHYFFVSFNTEIKNTLKGKKMYYDDHINFFKFKNDTFKVKKVSNLKIFD